jgi:hypothetical protein
MTKFGHSNTYSRLMNCENCTAFEYNSDITDTVTEMQAYLSSR